MTPYDKSLGHMVVTLFLNCPDLLHPGDVIHEINGKSIQGCTVDDVADFMVGDSSGLGMTTLFLSY